MFNYYFKYINDENKLMASRDEYGITIFRMAHIWPFFRPYTRIFMKIIKRCGSTSTPPAVQNNN